MRGASSGVVPTGGRRLNKFGSATPGEMKSSSNDIEDVFQDMEMEEEDREIKLAPIPEEVLAKSIVAPLKPGVTLRSLQLAAPLQLGGRQMKNLENEFVSIQLSLKKPRPFAVPTQDVCKKYNELRQDVVTLINMRNHIKMKQHKLDGLRSILKQHNKAGGGSHSASFSSSHYDYKKDKRKFGDMGGGSFKRRKMGKNPKFDT